MLFERKGYDFTFHQTKLFVSALIKQQSDMSIGFFKYFQRSDLEPIVFSVVMVQTVAQRRYLYYSRNKSRKNTIGEVIR